MRAKQALVVALCALCLLQAHAPASASQRVRRQAASVADGRRASPPQSPVSIGANGPKVSFDGNSVASSVASSSAVSSSASASSTNAAKPSGANRGQDPKAVAVAAADNEDDNEAQEEPGPTNDRPARRPANRPLDRRPPVARRPARRRPEHARPSRVDDEPLGHDDDSEEDCDDYYDSANHFDVFSRPMRQMSRFMGDMFDRMQGMASGDFASMPEGANVASASSSSYSGQNGENSRMSSIVRNNGRTRGIVSETRDGRTRTRRIGGGGRRANDEEYYDDEE